MSPFMFYVFFILVGGGEGMEAHAFSSQLSCNEALVEVKKLPYALGFTECTVMQIKMIPKLGAGLKGANP